MTGRAGAKERKTIAALEALGGRMRVDEGRPDTPVVSLWFVPVIVADRPEERLLAAPPSPPR